MAAGDEWTQEDHECVELALHTAETDNPQDVGSWPTVAGWLAAEVRRLRSELKEVCDGKA